MAKKFKIPTNKKRERLHLFNFEDECEKSCDIKSHIEFFANREATVEGCKGILDYDSNYIKLRLLRGSVILFGKKISVSFFEGSTIRIKGDFSSLEFSE